MEDERPLTTDDGRFHRKERKGREGFEKRTTRDNELPGRSFSIPYPPSPIPYCIRFAIRISGLPGPFASGTTPLITKPQRW